MYDFTTLSPLDFEELARDLLQEELGLRFESFGPGRDLGIDFRFASDHGTTIVQAKHYVGSGINSLLASVRKENDKILKLKPKRYLLVTSVRLTVKSKEKIRKILTSSDVIEEDILGKDDLNNLIRRHPKIERRHFKLWLSSTAVLERVLHSGVYNRTRTEMDVIRTLVPKFVHNQSVPKAESILEQYGSLIIAGEPGVGKTTLARMLVWLHAEQGWEIAVIDDVRDAFKFANEGQKRLIFFDDFLGQIKLSLDLVRGTDQRLPPLIEKVRRDNNLRFILTTRDYILRQAQSWSSRLSSPKFNVNELVLNVGQYTRSCRAAMLFNHIFFSDLCKDDKSSLINNDFFLQIIDHRNFSPRIIEFLTSSDYLTLNDGSIRDVVVSALDNPTELWEKPFRSHISAEGRVLMIALFFNQTKPSLQRFENSFRRMSSALGMDSPQSEGAANFREALKELEGSVVAIQDRRVKFSNPGVRDFLHRTMVADNYLNTVLLAVTDYEEVRQAWKLFCDNYVDNFVEADQIDLWENAIERMLKSNSSNAVKRLDLVLDVHERLETSKMLKFVTAAIEALDQEGLDGEHGEKGREVLERIHALRLPSETCERAKMVLTEAISEMLVEYGFCLNLEDIDLTADCLFEYGCNDDRTGKSIRSAFDDYLENLREILSDMDSIDELDEFERDLRRSLDRHGVFQIGWEQKIESRREDILNKEDWGGVPYRSSYGGKVSDISDIEIRSMFYRLLD